MNPSTLFTDIKHIAFIMDGNGRWATRRGLPRMEGHRQGFEALKRIMRAAPVYNLSLLTFYAFSTENWRRSAEEVEFLMSLPLSFLEQDLSELMQNKVKVIVSGRRPGVPPRTLEAMDRIVAATADNDALTINLAFNYGGRAEMVDAVRQLVQELLAGDIDLQQIDEAAISARLYQPQLPEPDLIIRTAGEQRLSNFLLWQSSYSELYFSELTWPDFNTEELERVLTAYSRRKRNFGAVNG